MKTEAMKTIITPPPPIGSHAELKQRIAYLESIKDDQEETLKENMREVYQSLQPAELIKKAIHNIRHDEELVQESTHLGVSLGLDLLVGKIFGKDKSMGGTLKSFAAKQIISLLYKKYEPRVHLFLHEMKDKVVELFKLDLTDKTPEAEDPETEDSQKPI
jgi:hypothetical protein